MNSAIHVFVYGRLRSGFWNQFLLGNQKPAGRGRTAEKYALYASAMPYVRMDQTVSPIRGEVYAVNERTLRDLDSLMAHPTWYRRCEVPVVLDDGPEMLAWMYARPGTGGVLVETGDLWNREAAAAGAHQEHEP
ncbi:MAG TPA: gamma-glutamylcyclotransferase [Candidatus Hydrogenedentes bacterium]|nr:gamma-glutamylcyclotransferase [Candidatus Hydrogenedentota bacterium]